MTRVNLLGDGWELVDDEPTFETRSDLKRVTCPGCLGKGRYVGLTKVEDPCSVCGGSGDIPEEISFADV